MRSEQTRSSLLTTRELAEALRVCPDTVRRWVGAGRIPCVRVAPRVTRYDLEAVLAALAEPPAEGGPARG